MRLLIAIVIYLSSITIAAQNFHTQYTYEEPANKGITIQNSYPKGGQSYTDPYGKSYVYVVFWTCITNERDTEVDLTIQIPAKSFTIPSSPGIDFKLLVPTEEMNIENETSPNYGLDIIQFLDKNLESPSKVNKTVAPHESLNLYHIALSDQGVNGVIRAGFQLEGQELLYTINDLTINCGQLVSQQ